MKLIIVRHAETDANKRGALNGQAESLLTELGKEQVLHVAKVLKDENIAAIYTSDLRRCVQTAEGIGRFHQNAPITHTGLLREIRLGKAEGAKMPLPKPVLKYIALIVMKLRITPPGGESWREVGNRVTALLDEIYAHHRNETVILVTHNVTMQAIRYVTERDTSNWKPGEIVPNCTIWRLNYPA